MTRRSIRDLTPQEVLIVGIDVEEANGTRLRTFADMFTDYAPEASELFNEMAIEEDEHGAQLEKLFEQRFGELNKTITQDDVLEVIEAHDLDSGEHFVFDDMTLRKALEITLAAELQAQAFYREARRNTDEPELQEIFLQLSEFETHHVNVIEARLEALGGTA